MPSRVEVKVAFFITTRKILAEKALYFTLSGFSLLIVFIWAKDSFDVALKFFLYLFPYIFLFFSQDMARGEIDSGCLENVIFLRLGYKKYLLGKNILVAGMAFLAVLALFVGPASYGLFTGQLTSLHLLQFGTGLIAGVYYVFLAGLLSHYLKGGSNVLLVIVGQALLIISLLLSAGQSQGFIHHLSEGVFPDFWSKMKFFGLVSVFPNIVISRKFFPWAAEILGLILLLGILQRVKVRRLELRKT